MTTILALDTSAGASSIALQHNGEVEYVHTIAPRQQIQLVLPQIRDVLAKFSLTVKDLDGIAFGAGPGSFTGIRIATSVAQGLAYAYHKPLVQISSLAALAQAAYDLYPQYRKYLVLVDARVKHVYVGKYKINSEQGLAEALVPDAALAPEDINIDELADCCVLGDAWAVYSSVINHTQTVEPLAVFPDILPTAKAILSLAQEKFSKGDVICAKDAFPTYLR